MERDSLTGEGKATPLTASSVNIGVDISDMLVKEVILLKIFLPLIFREFVEVVRLTL